MKAPKSFKPNVDIHVYPKSLFHSRETSCHCVNRKWHECLTGSRSLYGTHLTILSDIARLLQSTAELAKTRESELLRRDSNTNKVKTNHCVGPKPVRMGWRTSNAAITTVRRLSLHIPHADIDRSLSTFSSMLPSGSPININMHLRSARYRSFKATLLRSCSVAVP